MNTSDREALAAIAAQIDALTDHLARLEYLTEDETVKALKGLVLVAPTLGDLAEGYKAAGWFGKFIKWIGAIAGAVLAAVAIWTLYFGDGK
jgi:uncharacterized protein (DUF697 family)